MPYADPDRQREANKMAKRNERLRKGAAIGRLATGALPEPPSRDELMRALGVQAMKGSVPAIRLLLEELRRDEEPKPPVESVIARLAARRGSFSRGEQAG
jgi:hypothetical protein